MTINRICSLPFRLKKEQRAWLETMREDPREKVREIAESAYEKRFSQIREQRRMEDEIEAYMDSLEDEVLNYGEHPAFNEYPGEPEIADDLIEALPFK